MHSKIKEIKTAQLNEIKGGDGIGELWFDTYDTRDSIRKKN
jgi:hypothetical protein